METNYLRVSGYQKHYYGLQHGPFTGIMMSIVGVIGLSSVIAKDGPLWALILLGIVTLAGVPLGIANVKKKKDLKELSSGEMFEVDATSKYIMGGKRSRQYEVKYSINDKEYSVSIMVARWSEAAKFMKSNKNFRVFVPQEGPKYCYIKELVNLY